jgi:hypothetical protein
MELCMELSRVSFFFLSSFPSMPGQLARNQPARKTCAGVSPPTSRPIAR